MQAADAKPASSASFRASLLLGALSALAFALSFPLSDSFVAGWPLAFVWPALLAGAVHRAPRARALAVTVGAPFFAAFLAHEWWMRHITELGMPVLVLYLTGWTVLLALALRQLVRHRWPFTLALPVALVAIEFLRGDLVCSGYAWFFAAHPLVEWTPVAQIAALGGGWLLSALAGFVAGAAVDACVGRGTSRVVWPVAAALALASSFAYGRARLESLDAAIAATPRPRILVVQTNLPMSNKLAWTPEAQIEDFLTFARLTVDGARRAREQGGAVDLALWPETTVPGLGFEPDSIKTLVDGNYYPGDRYCEAMRDLATRIDAPLLVGSPAYLGLRVDGNRFRWDRQYNSAYLVGPDGPIARTDKIYLTPFGETMPIISNWDWLEEQLLALGAEGMTFDLDTATEPRVLELTPRTDAAGPPTQPLAVGVPICFEITMPWASRRIVFPNGQRAAGVVANLSNDGWFGPSRAGRRQHLQVSQLRAIELDTPVVRSVNTGLSASIDACGRIAETLSPESGGSFVATPTPRTGRPVSAIVGDGVAGAALLALMIGLCAPLFGRIRAGRTPMPSPPDRSVIA